MCQSIGLALPTAPLQASFDGPQLTSDGGLCWLAEAATALGLCATLAQHIPEWRQGPVRHALDTLVRQRVFQIACGYEDQNDAATLRTDPLLKLVCGRLPETGRDLASQPTFSRLENAVRATSMAAMALSPSSNESCAPCAPAGQVSRSSCGPTAGSPCRRSTTGVRQL